jgi:anaerobic selenocysteine-containing dehydrogenase
MAEVRHSVCALDCPDCCSLLINVDETGRGSRLRGDPAHPITRGFLCGKVAQYLERVYHPERLLYPQRRTGKKGQGQFERISWEQALDEIAARLQQISDEHGPEAVLPYSYAGTMGMLNGSGMDRRFFHRLGASRLDRTICAATGTAALLASQGITLGTEPEQFASSKLIIAWGANVLGTNVHLWPFIVEARRNGAKFYVIDPLRNRTGAVADRHFPIYPGSDQALALGMMHIILRKGWQDADYIARYSNGFEALSKGVASYNPQEAARLTGIAPEDIELLAREYACMRPAAIRLNYGAQRSEFGGAAMRAIAALPVLTGSWREVGGGLQLSTSGAFGFNRSGLDRADLQQHSPIKREARRINMIKLGEALTELSNPPVQALLVYNSNPGAVAPHQNRVLAGLERDDLFTVVLEQFQTDTVDYADIVLPVTTFLEHTDLYLAYGHYYVQMAEPALTPPGDTKSNVEIFRLLAKRMGFDDACFDDSEEDMIRGLLSSDREELAGITLERLKGEHFIRLNVSPKEAPYLPFAKGGFKTASSKFEFGSEIAQYQPPTESRFGNAELLERFPLELISAKNDDSMNSTFGNRDPVDQQTATCEMNLEDAAPRAISTGDRVRLFNDRGECYLEARVGDSVQRGVVRTRSTRWNKRSPDRKGINRLTSDRTADMGGGPVFYSCLVQVERCAADC